MQEQWELLQNGTKICTGGAHKVSAAPLLLARFCRPKPQWTVCDLGAGCGTIILSLIDSGLRGPALALEQDAAAIALLRCSLEENRIDNLEIQAIDLRGFRTTSLFDMVVANPPFYKTGRLPAEPARAAARHETSSTLHDFCAAAARMLKEKGSFCLCYPPEQLFDLFIVLARFRLTPKRLQLVRNAPGSAPWLALVTARKNGGSGLRILPELLLEPGAPAQPL